MDKQVYWHHLSSMFLKWTLGLPILDCASLKWLYPLARKIAAMLFLRSIICPHFSMEILVPFMRFRIDCSTRSYTTCSLEVVTSSSPLPACIVSIFESMEISLNWMLLEMQKPNFFLRKQKVPRESLASLIQKIQTICATLLVQTQPVSGSTAQQVTSIASQIHSYLSCPRFWFSKSEAELQFTKTQGVRELWTATTITEPYFLQGMRLWDAASATAPNCYFWQSNSQERMPDLL